MSSIQKKLSGPDAFYLQPDYIKKTEQALFTSQPQDPVYKIDFSTPAARIAKIIASIIIFPIGIYHALHCITGLFIIPPAAHFSSYRRRDLNFSRQSLLYTRPDEGEDKNIKFLRTSIKVDGATIDIFISGTPTTFKSKRWTLFVGGNTYPYEHTVDRSLNMLSHLKSNGIYFNYRGVGSSSGLLSLGGAVKAYRALLSFLEDKEKGIGAEEIVLYGWSMGGGIQGEALNAHTLLPHVRYVAVKDRTFADFQKVIAYLTNRVIALLVKLLGWNVRPALKAKASTIPEIILQVSQKNLYKELQNERDLIDDRMIPQDGSYAKEVFKYIGQSTATKVVLAAPPSHDFPLTNTKPLADRILTLLHASHTA